MKNYHITLFLGFMLLFFSCKTQPEEKGQTQPQTTSVSPVYEVLSPELFQAKINQTEAVQLVDVRTPEEAAEGMIGGAQNINLFDPGFKDKMANLDKSKPVLVYCKMGSRSNILSLILKAVVSNFRIDNSCM